MTSQVQEAIALFNQGRLDEAMQACAAALAAHPGNVDAYAIAATVESEKGNLAGSLALHQHALSLDPDNPTATTNHPIALRRGFAAAVARQRAGALVEAINLYRSVDRARPGDPSVAHNLEQAYEVLHAVSLARLAEGEAEQVFRTLGMALNESPKHVPLLRLLAAAATGVGDHAAAVVALATAKRLVPGSAEVAQEMTATVLRGLRHHLADLDLDGKGSVETTRFLATLRRCGEETEQTLAWREPFTTALLKRGSVSLQNEDPATAISLYRQALGLEEGQFFLHDAVVDVPFDPPPGNVAGNPPTELPPLSGSSLFALAFTKLWDALRVVHRSPTDLHVLPYFTENPAAIREALRAMPSLVHLHDRLRRITQPTTPVLSHGVADQIFATAYWESLKTAFRLGQDADPDAIWWVCMPGGSGDIMFVLAMLRQFRETYGGPIGIVTSWAWRDIAAYHASHFDHAIFIQAPWDLLRLIHRHERGWPIVPFAHLDHFQLIRHYRLKDIWGAGLGLLAPVVLAPPTVTPDMTAAARHRLTAMGLREGRTVVLGPHSRSTASPAPEWWEALVRELLDRGYDVVTNIGNIHNAEPLPPVAGSQALHCPYREIIPFVDLAGYFIASRSGLSDVVAYTEARKIFVYADRARQDSHRALQLSWSVSAGNNQSPALNFNGMVNFEEHDIPDGPFDPRIIAGW